MLRPYVRGPEALALLLGLILLLSADGRAENTPQPGRSEPVCIGMISTLFRDTPEGIVHAMMQPFGVMMEAQTGVPGKLIPGGDAEALSAKLAADKVQLGVFHGIEFAWVRLKYPDFKPLVIAINQHRQLHAYVVVHNDSPAAGLGDLKGKTFAVPKQTKEHCRVVVQQQCRSCGCEPGRFFASLTTPANLEEAMDDVVDKVVEATIVDGVGLECYQRRKPGRFARLKTVHRSEAFPAAVVAYRPGTIDEATLNKFRTGLLKANESALGKPLLNLWKLTAFEPVPANYEENLAAIVKTYPPLTSNK